MRGIYYSTIITIGIYLIIGCTSPLKKDNTLASQEEMIIIKEMNCWDSYINEVVMNQILRADSEKEKEKRWKEWHSNFEEANKAGRLIILNDSIFISCIRDSTSYKTLINKRKQLTKSLKEYKNKLPEFDRFLKKISDGVIDYSYYGAGNFGIYESGIHQKYAFYMGYDTFYESYSELLKEAYIENTSSTIKDEFIVSLNKLLSEIEEIDRHIWCIPYYYEALTEYKEEQISIEKEKKVNELMK